MEKEACEECTENCLMMHKKNKNPASSVTTFVKVMMGDAYSKTLFLPPKFACRVKKLVGKTTQLGDLNGEKWDVKYTKIDDRLAFEEGWNTFALKHGLQKGDILVFHYIMKSHFVVLMYGSTGCPEPRHFGFPHHPMEETKKSNNNLIVNGQSSSKVHTNGNNLSHESSSKCEAVVSGVNDMKTMNEKLKDAKMSPNENTTNAQHLVASSSQPVEKETDQRCELSVKNAFPGCMLSESPTTVKPLCLVDNDNGHEQDECRRKSLQPVVVESDGGQKNNVVASVGLDETELNRNQNSVELDAVQKNNVAASGGGVDETENNRFRKSVVPEGGQKNNVAAIGGPDETETNRTRKSVESDGGQKNNVAARGGGSDETEKDIARKSFERRMGMAAKKLKERNVTESEVAHNYSLHKRSRPANVPSPQAKTVKREPVTSVSRLPNSGYPSTSTGISPKSVAKPMEPIKKEPTTNLGSVGLVKEEPTMNHRSGGLFKEEPAMNHGSGRPIKREPKLEPVDYDEAPLSGSSNASFSATMSTYQYLELPGSVKLKSKVILLRNGADLWPVLYQTKYGLKALTQNWSIFAKEKGIKPGDVCEFVLESEPNSRFTCSVFAVHVTR